jgi:hypothetical protein
MREMVREANDPARTGGQCRQQYCRRAGRGLVAGLAIMKVATGLSDLGLGAPNQRGTECGAFAFVQRRRRWPPGLDRVNDSETWNHRSSSSSISPMMADRSSAILA